MENKTKETIVLKDVNTKPITEVLTTLQQQKMDDLQKQIESIKNGTSKIATSNRVTISSLFRELGQIEHKDVIDLSVDILKHLILKNKTNKHGNTPTLLNVVNNVKNVYVYRLESKKNIEVGSIGNDADWYNDFKVVETPTTFKIEKIIKVV